MKNHEVLDQSVLNCVKEDLRNAKENGHDFVGWTAEEIAGDIIAYDDDFADWTVERLAPYLKKALENDVTA